MLRFAQAKLRKVEMMISIALAAFSSSIMGISERPMAMEVLRFNFSIVIFYNCLHDSTRVAHARKCGCENLPDFWLAKALVKLK